MGRYFTYAEQAGHYFDRPHHEVARAPLETPAAWRGPDVAGRDDWRVVLSPAEVDELHAAVDAASATGKPLRELTEKDFPLPGLGAAIDTWRREVHEGRGFLVVSGVPTNDWSQQQSELFFWCLGLHLGRPGAQNPQDDLLGHVVDTGDWIVPSRTQQTTDKTR